MNSGNVNLTPLYKLVRDKADINHLNGRTLVARQFSKLANVLATDVALEAGFYLWGYYEKNGLWRNIYLGKAGFGKTSNLRARIFEELRDERVAVLISFFTKEQIWQEGARVYAKMWHSYQTHAERALRKSGCTHIFWVSLPELSDLEVRNVEADLIEILNPSANISRPPPPDHLQHHTRDVLAALRVNIHTSRVRNGSRYQYLA